nr:MMPL family transporter [Natranaeroarchaeum aerophilus]
MQSIGDELSTDDEVIVFGFGAISEEIDRSMGESLAIVGPLALLFVVVALAIAYRDLLDILLGTAGIFAVLIWTFGFMGWAGIQFNQIFIAVPVLLIGLSIDYAIHIFMRHREQREADGYAEGDGIRRAMTVGLTGVGVALVWVTATTVFGFLSNLVSPVAPIQEFGVVSSVGIVSALLIFGVLIPALKIELDELLEGWGFNRKKRAFGTGGGRFSDVLSTGAILARKAPVAIILVALVISAGGAIAGSQVDTSFEDEDFLADDPPDWMKNLPDAIAPGDYSAKANFEYVNENFVRQDTQANILVRGDATDAETLERIDAAEAEAGETDSAVILSRGGADTESPIGTMQSVADRNESFNETFTDADTTGDGIPDENIEEVYDELYNVAPDEAANVIYRTDDGEYEALLLTVSVRGSAATADVTSEMRAVAGGIDDDGSHETRSAIATGGPIVNEVIQGQLFDTVIQSLLVTLVTVFAFLGGIYRLQHGSAILGVITLLPVALAVSWILGTMYVLGMPFNVLTGMITSLTVGLGVAYSIHISERYNLELARHESAWDAMHIAVTGTGGALLGSAATTVGGFGVLAFAILPVLQQFGIITGMTIIYAFLGSVIVLPSLLVLWTRYIGPAEKLDVDPSDQPPDDSPETGSDDAAAPPASNVDVASADAPSVERVATRSLAQETLEPGDQFEATITVEASDGRVVLAEEAPGEGGHVTELTPEPVECEQVGRTLYVLWESVTPVDLRMSYVATVPEDVPGGETIEFNGRVTTADGARPVGGTETVPVRTPLLERLNDEDAPDEDVLSEAGAGANDGDITRSTLEDVYRRWVSATDPNDDGSTASEPATGEDGSFEGHARAADTDGGTDRESSPDDEEGDP